MSHPIVGFLEEQGHSAEEIGELLTPMEIYDESGHSAVPSKSASDFGKLGTPFHRYDGGSPLAPVRHRDQHEALRSILTVARDSRQLPGKQMIVKTATAKTPGAKPIRVDTEASHRKFRRSMKGKTAVVHGDAVDDLSNEGQAELMGELVERSLVNSELLSGLYERAVTTSEELSGSLVERGLVNAELLGADQACIVCGRGTDGGAACVGCRQKLAVLGLFERGSAAEGYGAEGSAIVGFGERGSAADIYEEIIGDVMALESGSSRFYDDPEEVVPLSFSKPDEARHISSWQKGPNLYSAIRVTGWDREPRILTATMPYSKAMGVVVGYAGQAGVAPAHLLAMAHPLAQQLGTSSLLPRIAASSPAVLRAVHKKCGPLIVSTVSASK